MTLQLVFQPFSGRDGFFEELLGAALYDPVFTSGIASSTDLAICIVGFGLLTVWRLSPLFVVAWCVAASLLPALV